MIEKVILNNKEMNYFKFGYGKKIMVMIPGLSIKSVMLAESDIINMYKMFEKDYTVYCFDRITNPNKAYSLIDMANDTIEAIEKLNLDDIYLFGASQGGMISMLIALKRCDLVKKIAIASSCARIDDFIKEKMNEFINYAKDRKKEELVLEFSKLIYPIDYYKKIENFLTTFSNTITNKELDDFIIFANAIFDNNIIDKINNIKIPFMQFHDTTDKLINIDLAYEIKNKMNNDYSLITSNGYGHVLYDLSNDFRLKMLEFFNE